MIYRITDTSKPSERLRSWSKNVGQSDRNVLHLTKNCIYSGSMLEFKEIAGYKPNFNVQGTMCVNESKSLMYFDKIFNE